jgi:hypothetical protein
MGGLLLRREEANELISRLVQIVDCSGGPLSYREA